MYEADVDVPHGVAKMVLKKLNEPHTAQLCEDYQTWVVDLCDELVQKLPRKRNL